MNPTMYRLAVIQTAGATEAVVECDGKLLPAKAIPGIAEVLDSGNKTGDLQPLLSRWEHCDALLARFVAENREAFANGMSIQDVHFVAPLAAPGKFVCIGSNYHDHIAEMPIPMTPTYPYAFMKPVNNTVRGPGDPVAVPRKAKLMDWEAELGVVIGKQGSNVSAADALGIVAGYVNFNDLSARDWLSSRPPIGVDWVQHKAFDGFAPIGPYVVPARFIPNPQDLPVKLSVNGVLKQNSNTSEMVFGVAAIIEHLSSIMTLYPGDIIATGTPAGTGHGKSEYLKAGDIVRMEVGSLGELTTPIV